MIFEAVVGIFAALLQGVVSLFGSVPPPGWWLSAAGSISGVMALASGVGAWVPWSFMSTVIQAVLACYAVSFTIRLVRIVLSVFTGGGGSAG